MKKLTISIVNYNAGEYLLNCLDSLAKLKDELGFEVYVVDNVSTDGSVKKAKEKFPEFNFIFNEENLGFGKAHNLVLKKAVTPYVLTLNPDCEVPKRTLSHMVEFMEKNPEVGISSSKVEKADGSLDIASHRGFPTPWASILYFLFKNDRLYHLTDRNMNVVHEVDSVVGAFMLMSKRVLEEVGYFDEDYFLYGEDLDLCFRIKNAGFKVMYVPEVKVIHVKGVSSGIKKHSQEDSNADISTKNSSINYFYSTMKIFYKKHYAKKYPFFINWIVYVGIDIKLLLAKRNKLV